jgi:hypothetical protein
VTAVGGAAIMEVREGTALDDENALVERARRGDLDAYQVLVRMHQDAIVRMAAAVSGGWADAEAVAQEALIKAYRALDRFRPGAPFRPWLFRIVINEARNAERAAQRRHRLTERAGRVLGEHSTPSPETRLLDADERRQLLAAVRRRGRGRGARRQPVVAPARRAGAGDAAGRRRRVPRYPGHTCRSARTRRVPGARAGSARARVPAGPPGR